MQTCFARRARAAIAVAALCWSTSALAEVLTFEELDPGYAATAPMPTYRGFTWTNAAYVAHPTPPAKATGGVFAGTLGVVAVRSPGAGTALVVARQDLTPFTFTSAYVTAAESWSETVTVEGVRAGVTKYTSVVLAGSTQPCFHAFDFADVDRVVMTSAGGAITIDDVAVTSAPDTIPPTITISEYPAITRSETVYLEGWALDQDGSADGLTSTITVNGIPSPAIVQLGPGGSFQSFVPLTAEGVNEVSIEVTDPAGNVARRALSITRDSIPPTVAFVTPTADVPVPTHEVAVSVRVDDASPVSVAIDGSDVPIVNGLATATLWVWQPGPFQIFVSATDAAGNQTVAYGDAIAAFTDDFVSIDVASGSVFGPLPDDRLPIRISVSSAFEAVVRTVSGEMFTVPCGGGSVETALPLQDGANDLWVAVEDLSGRSATVSVLVTYDRTPPAAAFRSPQDGAVVRGTVEVALDASDATSSIVAASFSVDGGPAVEATTGALWTASLDLGGLADGPHAISATVVDAVGNRASAIVNVVSDAVAPSVSIASPAAGDLVRGELTVTARASDATSALRSLRVLANGVELAACDAAAECSGVLDTAALPDGPAVVAAIATDLAGNSVLVQAEVLVDNSAPSRFLLAPAPGQFVTGSMALVFGVDDPGFAHAECFVGGVSLGSTTEPAFSRVVDVTSILDGPLDVACTAVDRAGNSATAVTTVTVLNWTLRLDPGVLLTAANAGTGSLVTLYVEGPNVALLAPASAHALSLAVTGGTSVPLVVTASSEQVADSDRDGIPDLTLKFERRALLSAMRAAVAAGVTQPGAPMVVRLLAGARVLGVAHVEVR